MSARQSCSLCGGVFTDRQPGQDQPEETKWMTEGRAVRGPMDSSSNDAPTVTGLGYFASPRLTLPVDYEATYLNSNEQPNAEIISPNLKIKQGHWYRAYGVHEFCWQALVARVGKGNDPTQTGSWLFHLFHSLQWAMDGFLIPENKYHGGLRLRGSESGLDFMKRNPTSHVPPVTEEKYPYDSEIVLRPSDPSQDIFRNLPLEVNHMIICLLPDQDMANVRLSSRHLATLTSNKRLPAVFWSSRFLPEGEMGFVYMNSLQEVGDWRKLFFDCRRSLRVNSPEGLCFQNRRRIWRCLLDCARILTLLIDRHGSFDNLGKQTGGILPTPDSRSLGLKVACPRLPSLLNFPPRFEQISHLGTRVRETRPITFNSEFDLHKTIVGVSIVDIEPCTYVSGVRVSVLTPLDRQMRVAQEVGLINASCLKSFMLKPGDAISCVRVHLSTSGVHALSFFITQLDGTSCVRTVGSPQKSGNRVAVSDLTAKSAISGLLMGFDLYKAVSVQVIESSPSKRLDLSPTHPIVWKPAIPPLNDPVHREARIMRDSIFGIRKTPIFLYMPLGGRDGSRLHSLCKITALVHHGMGFYGFVFAYDEGDEVLFGERDIITRQGDAQACTEQSILINGAQGERVIHFATCSNDERGVVKGVEIRTNVGRCYEFCGCGGLRKVKWEPLTLRTKNAGREVLALVVLTQKGRDYVLRDIRTEQGNVVPVARLRKAQKEYFNLGSTLIDDIWLTIQRLDSRFRTASLQNVRRIRVSAGEEGSPRMPGCISGLLFEYENSSNNTTVGQWIKEYCVWELEGGEIIDTIQVWTTRKIKYDHVSGMSQVVRIKLHTKSGSSWDCNPGNTTVGSLSVFDGNPFEQLSSFGWAFGSIEDEIQVLAKATESLGVGRLLLAHHNTHVSALPGHMMGVNTRLYLNLHPLFNYETRIEKAMKHYFFIRPITFHETDTEGNRNGLSAVSLITDSLRRLIGISFHFRGGRKKSHGTTTGQSFELTLDVEKGERFSYLLVFGLRGDNGEAVGIELQTTAGRRLRAGIEAGSVGHVTTYPLMPEFKTPDANFLSLPGLVGAAVRTHRFPSQYQDRPVRRCVGLWVALRERIDLSGLQIEEAGPVYLADDEDFAGVEELPESD